MKTIQKVILKLERDTINRGKKQFIISSGNGGFYSHEVGKPLEICEVIGGDERYAHRLNKSMRYGNQYIRSWKPKPFMTMEDAVNAVIVHANTKVQYF